MVKAFHKGAKDIGTSHHGYDKGQVHERQSEISCARKDCKKTQRHTAQERRQGEMISGIKVIRSQRSTEPKTHMPSQAMAYLQVKEERVGVQAGDMYLVSRRSRGTLWLEQKTR